jgi:hypothetical protein
MRQHSEKCVSVHQVLRLPEGRPISGKAGARLKNELAPIQFFGKTGAAKLVCFPGFAGPARPPGARLCFWVCYFLVMSRIIISAILR